ncbi:hypothetical protein HWQ46_09440 [Shewanella sp. D64]|uniref:hypothetical protein n=1 Tax=unclassified Shewanella TaxID=196818 RepID=UPI0022BA293D|nr:MULTISPECIES: hypothetical protein [unclassified Shewanella]MEC4725765.1 hypothetical protein [Shewanella sp. D64]MEC4737628.1 hypothetical protein [Shewanella sp. E94]WBJ93441.1 hypothetical protein HWQ47_16045 [Shewanella sp. MTB7]
MSVAEAVVDVVHDFIGQDQISQLPKNNQVYEYINKKLVNFNYEGQNLSATEALAKGLLRSH